MSQQASQSIKGVGIQWDWFPTGTALQGIGLAIMAGGMLALGAFTAPTVFHTLPREEAAPLMAQIFTRFDTVLQMALGLALLGEALRRAARPSLWIQGLGGRLRLVILALLTVTLLYATVVVNPQITELNRAGVQRNLTTAQGQRFERVHRLSENLYKLDLLLVLLLLILTPFVDARPQEKSDSKKSDTNNSDPSLQPTDAG
ncbi:DUF4149 domain-containing protein [Vampirovibrio chlorellavorus]|uniref:DUF4149 domain-containing protein n=1 Tax=Vampirovibrio chlorellavorus TaxID=758823 RepID=UPI0026F22CE4|nr:DUF4149 domain-containing protein [Vampirovibrio chlorellavorus]